MRSLFRHGARIVFTFAWSVCCWPWRVYRWMMQTRPIRFTRFGLFYILFSLAVGAAAINTGNNLLYLILGILLGFIVVSGFLSDSCLWGLEMTWQPVGSFYARQRGGMDLRLHKRWFPAIAVRIETSWKDLAKLRHLFYWVPRNGAQTIRLTLPPARRGMMRLEAVRYSTCFPFGLFEKFHQATPNDGWVVFPEIRPLPLHQMLTDGFILSQDSTPSRGVGTTPYDLRDYRPGDPSKRIHWKTSAKRQRLMVIEMQEEGELAQTVQVRYWPTGDCEDFISFLASLVYALYQKGRPVGLATPGVFLKPDAQRAHIHRLLTYLALVDPQQEIALPAWQRRPGTRWVDAMALWDHYGGGAH